MEAVETNIAIIKLALIGIGVGMIISTPIGPVNLMVIRNTLNYGIIHGLAACAGVIIGDACFALIAAFGISALSDIISKHVYIIQIIGGTLIAIVGIIALTKKPKWEINTQNKEKQNPTPIGIIQSSATTFILTITNPATFMILIVIFGGFSIQANGYLSAIVILTSIISGTILWWTCVFFGLVTFLKEKINLNIITAINQTTAVIIITLGAFMILKAVI